MERLPTKNGKFTNKTWCYNLWLYWFEIICPFHGKPDYTFGTFRKRTKNKSGKTSLEWTAIGKQTDVHTSSQVLLCSPINYNWMGWQPFSQDHPIVPTSFHIWSCSQEILMSENRVTHGNPQQKTHCFPHQKGHLLEDPSPCFFGPFFRLRSACPPCPPHRRPMKQPMNQPHGCVACGSQWDVPWNKASSYWGIPMTVETCWASRGILKHCFKSLDILCSKKVVLPKNRTEGIKSILKKISTLRFSRGKTLAPSSTTDASSDVGPAASRSGGHGAAGELWEICGVSL